MSITERLVAAGKELDWKPPVVWAAYMYAGGTKDVSAVRRWLNGTSRISYEDSEILFPIINARLKEIGKEPLLPELVLPNSGSSAVGRRGIEPRTYWLEDAA